MGLKKSSLLVCCVSCIMLSMGAPMDKVNASCPEGTTASTNGENTMCNKETVNYVTITVDRYIYKPVEVDIQVLDIIRETGDGYYGEDLTTVEKEFEGDDKSHSTDWILDETGSQYFSSDISISNLKPDGSASVNGDTWNPDLKIVSSDSTVVLSRGKMEDDMPSFIDDLSKVNSSEVQYEVVQFKLTDVNQFNDKINAGQLNRVFTHTSEFSDDYKTIQIGTNAVPDLSKLTVTETGDYVIAFKIIDYALAKKDPDYGAAGFSLNKYTSYSYQIIKVNLGGDLGYLPIYNSLEDKFNSTNLVGLKKVVPTKLVNPNFENFKSMKIPSAADESNGNILYGSPNGGLMYLSKEYTPITINPSSNINVPINGLKVTQIQALKNKGFYLSTSIGILFLDSNTNTLTLVDNTLSVSAFKLSGNVLFAVNNQVLKAFHITESSSLVKAVETSLPVLSGLTTFEGVTLELIGDFVVVTSKKDNQASRVLILENI